MQDRLLHVFRNTPLGRESLLQSLYFCRTVGAGMQIYIPVTNQFMMYFDHDAVQVDLDSSYLSSPQTAQAHALALAEKVGIKPSFFEPRNFTAHQLPDIPTGYTYMCCPRSISDLTSKLGLGFIGQKVRRIIKSAAFPVLIPAGAAKFWNSITVFYGGSINANKALRWGLNLSRISGLPLDMFTDKSQRPENYFEERIAAAGLSEEVAGHVREWRKFSGGRFSEYLYEVPHDALLVVGAYGHGLIKDFLFGSKMELIQSWMPNSMLLVGPNCIAHT